MQRVLTVASGVIVYVALVAAGLTLRCRAVDLLQLSLVTRGGAPIPRASLAHSLAYLL
jgi:hypothetical protein